MKNLTLSLEEEVILLDKYGITSTELMLIRTLLILQDDGNEDLFGKYFQTLHNCNIELRDLLVSLQDKSIILRSYKIPESGKPFDPYSIPFNKNFLKNLYKSSYELGKELFEAYPHFATISGNLVSIRGVSRHFNSLEDAYLKYAKYINWSEERHNRIIELIEWAKEHDVLNMSLSSFIVNNAWESLEALKNGDKINVNYDAIKLV